jgi:aspartokinase-like uncharacterized kinase
VREAQKQWRFDDAAAHAMGLRAMEQFGLMLCGLQKGLVPCRTEAELRRALRKNQVPVWLPAQTLASGNIPPSWDVTSDSLAAWLARRLSAERLVLVKSCAPPKGKPDMAQLSKKGIVDAAFSRYIHAADFVVQLVGRKDYVRFPSLLAAARVKASR